MTINSSIEYTIKEIYDSVTKMLENAKIPAVYLKNEHLGFDTKDGNYSEMNPVFSLFQIFEMVENKSIKLPTVQRGFVWKANQIENLWDSLLRGYPVGCFVLAPGLDGFDLLDGQQRATALCLGNYHHEKAIAEGDILNSSYEKIRIFIDMEKPSTDDESRKYFIRVITHSHPWGFQKKENHKTLESNKIRQALKAFNLDDENYFDQDLGKMWPFDSKRPIPLGLFIDAALNGISLEKLTETISNWENQNKELVKFLNKSSNDQNLNHEILESDYQDPNEEISSISNTENLFIRMNAGGTPLSGEELNYSILKSNIKLEVTNILEKSCAGFIRPSRFITIAYRLFQNVNLISSPQLNKREILSMNVKPRQFQGDIRTNSEAFGEFLLILVKDFKIIEKVKNILIYDKNNEKDIGLPIITASKFTENSAEIIFILFYRLYVMNDKIDSIESRRKVIGIVTLFSWFGKSGKQKNHAALLRNVWPCVTNIKEMARFWSRETVARAGLKDYGKDVFINVPKYKELEKIVTTNYFKNKEDYSKNIYSEFIFKMFFNRDAILYSQREFLCTQYENLFKSSIMSDINLPFDWDHISPSERIDGQRKIPAAIRDWYGSVGNFRAWPYGWNRADGSKSPKEKLSDLRLELKDEEEKWFKRAGQHSKSIERSEFRRNLPKFLCSWSFCNSAWKDFDFKTDEIQGNTIVAKKLNKLIMDRNLDVAREWYEKLKIEDLLLDSEFDNVNFSKLLDMRSWRSINIKNENPEYWDKTDVGIELPVSLDDQVTLLISYVDSKDQYPAINLSEENIYVALRFQRNERNYFCKDMPGYIRDLTDANVFYITTEEKINLLSFSDESHYHFLCDVKKWIENIPDEYLVKYGLDKGYILDRFKFRVVNSASK
ncbi:DUF262 domain-containing protein [Bacteriovorax sp. PP10]|uniref:DUF262 domain-containing protein n=1 Tax=Bacteriovorax antarcticus TaxID=3088717 RepID=A0ABU5VXC8_9BACT|nr:DUF262 domain-containing protein [Bacteriovorax sp. PP10]MEA9357257.1 DUF262 domain-containing protein [Bacteriovorax sp. PP10]